MSAHGGGYQEGDPSNANVSQDPTPIPSLSSVLCQVVLRTLRKEKKKALQVNAKMHLSYLLVHLSELAQQTVFSFTNGDRKLHSCAWENWEPDPQRLVTCPFRSLYSKPLRPAKRGKLLAICSCFEQGPLK